MLSKHLPNFEHLSSPRKAALMLAHVIIGPRNFQDLPLLNALTIRRQWEDVSESILDTPHAKAFPEIFALLSTIIEKDEFIYNHKPTEGIE